MFYTVANTLYIIKLLYNSTVSMVTDAIHIILYIWHNIIHSYVYLTSMSVGCVHALVYLPWPYMCE